MSSLASKLRDWVRDSVELFEEAGGVSSDPHWSETAYHPMAEGQYLMVLERMHASGLMSSSGYGKRSARALDRLESAALRQQEGLAWGLGFPHGGVGADEPYVITSALIVAALTPIASEIPKAAALLEAGARWLDLEAPMTSVDVGQTSALVPHYSPKSPVVITNAVAVWAAALSGSHLPLTSNPELTAQWLCQEYVPGAGWTYAPGHSRVDLIHQSYILTALGTIRGFRFVERLALDCLSPFVQRDTVIDKYDIFGTVEAIRRVTKTTGLWLRPMGGSSLVLHPDKARPWAIGALLVLCSKLQRSGRYPGYWRALARQCARGQIDDSSPETITGSFGLRQTMHLAHGFSALLANLRANGATQGQDTG